MFTFKKSLAAFLLSIIILVFILQSVSATATNFTVHGSEEVVKKVNLAVEDHVLIRFTVVGADNALNFSIVYPNGTVQNFGVVGDFSYSFVCDVDGECVLRFSNSYSAEDKFVALDYEVEHYIFGVPQMLFLVMVIAVVCVVAVAVFVLMGKPR